MRASLPLLSIACVAVSCGAQRPAAVIAPGRATAGSASAVSSARAGGTLSLQVGRAKLIPLVSDSWETRDELVLDKDRALYVGSSGQRWLAREEPVADDQPTKHILTGASMMAPETLIAARKKADGTFLFVGESGATYSAREALSDFVTVRTPPEPLRAVAVGKSAIVGISRNDALLRSTDEGASFSAVAAPKTAAIPVQLVGSPRGDLAALLSPARVVASTDDGASFRLLSADGLGPSSITRSGITDLLYFRGYMVSPTKPPGFAAIVGTNGVLERINDAPALVRTPKSPSGISRPMNDEDRLDLGQAVQNGHAVMHELRYLEVRNESPGLVAFVLDGGKVSAHPIAASEDCNVAAVANSGATVIVECQRDVQSAKGAREELHFFRSGDFGKTFVRDGGALADPDGVRALAVSSKGTLFVAGGCLSATPCTELLTRAAGAKSFTAAKVPNGLRVQRLITAAEGDRVFAIATNDDDGGYVLLASRDGGKSFASRPSPIERFDEAATLAYDDATSTLGIFIAGGRVTRHVTRDEGVTWDTRELSFAADWISLAGARGLATAAGKGYETLDFGATFGPVPLPPSSAIGGTLPVACTSMGCLLGDVALREGWELKTAADVKPIPPAAAAAPKLVHLPPVECVGDGDEVEAGAMIEPEIDPSPALSWAAVVEATGGAVDMVMWPRGGKAIQRVPMLAAPKEASGIRRWFSTDGAIVMRTPRSDGKAVVDIELAWWVASTNKVYKGTLSKAATSLGKWGTPSGMAAIVPGHGLYVRPGNSTDAALYLIKEGSAVSKVSIASPFPAYPRLFARRTAKGTIFAGPTHETLAGDRVVMFTQLADSGQVSFHAWSLWPRTRARAELAISGEHLVLAIAGDAMLAPRNFALPWKDAPIEAPEPIALPVGKNLSEAPACASSGARIELPWTTGSRTPYTVRVDKRSMYLATAGTTLRVGDKTICARGTLAGHPSGSSSSDWLIVPADDPAHGFVFMRKKTHVMARVSCAPSSAPLPPAFSNGKGFTEAL